MTSRYIKPGNHWFWFFSLLIGYSVYDYIEHVTRPGQIFGEHPWAWLAFTFSLVAVDILTICFVNAGLKKLFRRERGHLGIELLAVVSGVFVHLKVAGPVLGAIFFPYSGGGLHFSTNPLVYLIALVPFLVVRLAVYLVSKVVR